MIILKINKFIHIIFSFLVAVSIFSSAIFIGTASPKKELDANQNVAEPYNAEHLPIISKTILINITDLSLCFLLTLNSRKNEITVFSFPKESVKNSDEHFNTNIPETSCYNLFGKRIDKTISLSQGALKKIVDFWGGVIIYTTYGFKSPSNSEITLPYTEEKEQIFGAVFVQILADYAYPDEKMLLYFSELMLSLIKKIITEIDENSFAFLFDNCETNINYKNFIDAKAALPYCAKNLSYSSAKGVWLGNEFFLQ